MLVIVLFTSPIQGFSQIMRIPVIPYIIKKPSVPTKIHNKCKSIVNYNNCVKRYSRVY